LWVLFFLLFADVLLIRKERPSWQKGKLNGIGGHVELNESLLEAMRRECKEETDLDIENWVYVCSMEGNDWQLEVFTSEIGEQQFKEAKNKTDDSVEVHHLGTVWDELAIPNCKWLVPMCWEHMKNPFTFKVAKFEY
jgi:8-oxo-dGTP pyrophosphatase MutT (NUDIX family)